MVVTDLINRLTELISVENPPGLLAIAALAVMADLGLPIPLVVEPALFLVSYQAGPLSLPVFLFVASLHFGRQLGTAALYWASRLLGPRFTDWIGGHFGRFGARVSHGIESFKTKMRSSRQNELRLLQAVTVARLTPGLLPVVTVASGTLSLPYHLFVVAVMLSGLIYDMVIVGLGYAARQGLSGITPGVTIWLIIGVTVLFAVLPGLIRFLARKIQTAIHVHAGPRLRP